MINFYAYKIVHVIFSLQEKVKSCSSRLKDLQATSNSSEEAVKLATKVRE